MPKKYDTPHCFPRETKVFLALISSFLTLSPQQSLLVTLSHKTSLCRLSLKTNTVELNNSRRCSTHCTAHTWSVLQPHLGKTSMNFTRNLMWVKVMMLTSFWVLQEWRFLIMQIPSWHAANTFQLYISWRKMSLNRTKDIPKQQKIMWVLKQKERL